MAFLTNLRTRPGFLFLALIFVFTACKEDDVPTIQYEVPNAVQSFIDEFEDEALNRGRDIQIEDLIVKFGKGLESSSGVDAAGLCKAAVGLTPEITLDSTSTNWTNSTASREALVFHELGHCILGYLGATAHRNDELPNGNVKSIMHEGGGTIYGMVFNYFKRDYYLDELFDPNTEIPEWSSNLPAYNTVDASQKTVILLEDFDDPSNINRWSKIDNTQELREIDGGKYVMESRDGNFHLSLISKFINTANDFEIEINMRLFEGNASNTFEWGSTDVQKTSLFGFTPEKSVFLGNRSFGVTFSKTIEEIDPFEFTKFTIRKIGNSYFFYVNELLVDNGMFEPFTGRGIGFGVGPHNTIEIDYLYIHRITS